MLYFNLLLAELAGEGPALPEGPDGETTWLEKTKQNKTYLSKLSQTMTYRVHVDSLPLTLMSLQEIVWVFGNFFGSRFQ